jgi:hypothetical protein
MCPTRNESEYGEGSKQEKMAICLYPRRDKNPFLVLTMEILVANTSPNFILTKTKVWKTESEQKLEEAWVEQKYNNYR